MKSVKTLCAINMAASYQEALITLSQDKDVTKEQKKKLLRAAIKADEARLVISEIMTS